MKAEFASPHAFFTATHVDLHTGMYFVSSTLHLLKYSKHIHRLSVARHPAVGSNVNCRIKPKYCARAARSITSALS
jgi:hypothetical protein